MVVGQCETGDELRYTSAWELLRAALMRPHYVLNTVRFDLTPFQPFSVSLMILDDESYSGFRCRQHFLPTIHAFPDRNTELHNFTPTPGKLNLLTLLKQVDVYCSSPKSLAVPLGRSINLNFSVAQTRELATRPHLNDDLTKNNDKHMSELSSADDNSHC